MKILVIDKDESISVCLATVEAQLFCHQDEIQALNAAETQQPAVIFLAYDLRGEETPYFIRMLSDAAPATRLVVIGAQIDENAVIQCMLAGAKGFQELAQLSHYAIRLIQALLNDEAWLSRKSVARLIDSIRLLTA